MAPRLRRALPADAARIAQLLIDARSAFMPYAPMAHSPAEVLSWVTEFLVPSGGTVVAESDGAIVGAMATEREASCSWITQMAVHPMNVGTGIGSTLLQHAFRTCTPPIRLYTFQANIRAHHFYEQHGFRVIGESDGQENEEHCPDVLYELTAAQSRV